ncbi:hypothetical protein BVC71_07255 [Marivivens niveibacter]|uniref:EamA domain-containing protein n=1 Tax=Marivivens niveibacter TaxID=1930667 RepID=A0A251WZS2_9RHOB|nr:hypothetical protein [Marivivens niveibacter]OUD09628.1 hypothetical protein BVC71_07255 [Marivivens niveibacter]
MEPTKSGGNIAIAFMLIAVLLYSLFPLVGVFGTVKVSGFVFAGMGHCLSAAVSIGGTVWLTRRRKGYNLKSLSKSLLGDRRVLFQAVQSGVINYLSHACLFASFVYISKATASIVYEIWPIIALFFLAVTHPQWSKGTRWAALDRRIWFLSFAAFVGLVIIVIDASQLKVDPMDPFRFILSREGKIGLTLAALSAIFMAYSVALGRNIRLYVEEQYGGCEATVDQINRALLASAATKVFGAVGFVLTIPFLPNAVHELANLEAETLGWAVLNGVVIVTLGSLSYREALARSAQVELTIMWYLTPVIALLWLWLAGVETLTITVGVGATLIVSANALLQMRSDTTPAFIGVFLSVAITGALVTLSDPFTTVVLFEDFNLIDLVALPVGFIGILGGFLLQRLSDLQSQSHLNAMALVDYAQRKDPNVDVDTVCDMIKGRASLPEELQHHARELMVAEAPVIRAGELLVMWSLSAFCILMIVLFRADNIVGDTLAITVVPSLTYILLHLTFDARTDLRSVVMKVLCGADHLANVRQSVWSLVIIGVVGMTLVALNLLKHI